MKNKQYEVNNMNMEKFLRKLKIWTKYNKNLDSRRKGNIHLHMLEVTPCVEEAFTWAQTPEGFDYWDKIYKLQIKVILKAFKNRILND